MPDFQITPADAPNLLCHFTIPRTGKAPIEFTIRRPDYVPELGEKYAKWMGERMTPTEKDALGEPVPREPISDKEAVIEQLRIAGVPAATCKQLYGLTMGECNEIFKHWTDSARVSPGESQPSDS